MHAIFELYALTFSIVRRSWNREGAYWQWLFPVQFLYFMLPSVENLLSCILIIWTDEGKGGLGGVEQMDFQIELELIQRRVGNSIGIRPRKHDTATS